MKSKQRGLILNHCDKFDSTLIRSATLLFIILLILMLILAIAGIVMNNEQDSSTIPDISFAGDIGYSELSDGEVVVQAVTGLCFNADAAEQDVYIPNSEKNECSFVVSIYLGDGTLLYESPVVKPGNDITSISLYQTLDEGVYHNAVMVYKFCSDSEPCAIVSQCEFPIEIRSVN